MRAKLLALLGLTIVSTAGAQVPAPAPQPARPEVSASGAGQVMVKPDLVSVTFTVVTRGRSAADAGKKNVAAITPLLAAMKRQAIPDSAVKTVGYSVARDDDIERTETGTRVRAESEIRFTARNAVSVTVRDLAALGAVIDTALANGASEAANIGWASSAARAHRLTALGLAVQAARAEAEAMARAAGGSLGELIELSEGAQYQTQFAAMRLRSADGGNTPLSPQDVTISANVRVRWLFVPGPR